MSYQFFWLLESTVFKSVWKAVYSVQNKPLSELQNWWGLLFYKDTLYLYIQFEYREI